MLVKLNRVVIRAQFWPTPEVSGLVIGKVSSGNCLDNYYVFSFVPQTIEPLPLEISSTSESTVWQLSLVNYIALGEGI